MSTINLSPDRLVTILSEPGADPDYVTITGWVGESPTASTVRIYTTPALDEYVEFGTDAVVHREQGEAANAPSTVWVRASHEGTRVQTAGRAAQIAIINGDMTNAYLDDDEVAGFALDSRAGDGKYAGPVVQGVSPTVTASPIGVSIVVSVVYTLGGVDSRKGY